MLEPLCKVFCSTFQRLSMLLHYFTIWLRFCKFSTTQASTVNIHTIQSKAATGPTPLLCPEKGKKVKLIRFSFNSSNLGNNIHSLASSLGTPPQSNKLQYSNCATNSTFTMLGQNINNTSVRLHQPLGKKHIVELSPWLVKPSQITLYVSTIYSKCKIFCNVFVDISKTQF